MRKFGLQSITLLVATMLVACSGTPVAVSPSASPSGGAPSATPVSSGAPGSSPLPSTQASAMPSTPVASPSVVASAVVSPVATQTGILRGQVYTGPTDFAPNGTIVTVTSLDPTQPYTGSAPITGGSYVLNGVPFAVQLQVTAHVDGYTTRSRVLVIRPVDPRFTDRNVYNFGGPASTSDPAGPGFYLSNHPEIESVDPVDQDTSRPNDQMRYKIVLSEPLDATNQRRLASAIQIIPNSQESLGTKDLLPADVAGATVAATAAAVPLDLAGLRIGSITQPTTPYRYRQNSGYLNGFAVSDFTWSPDNRTATFTLQAPVKTGNLKEGQYAFVLISQDTKPIVNAANNALGMDINGVWGAYTSGSLIYRAVKKNGLVLAASLSGKDEDRWIDTHQSWTQFSVIKDTVAPRLLSVLARRNYVDSVTGASDRIEFTFSKPMVAFPSIKSAGLLSLNNYVVTSAPTTGELASHDIAGLKATPITPNATSTAQQTATQNAVKGTAGMVVDSDSAAAGDFSINLSVKDPKVVILSLPAGSLPLDSEFIKAYAGNDSNAPTGANTTVADPAGNNIDSSANTAVGPIL
jgi:hypothetical protein